MEYSFSERKNGARNPIQYKELRLLRVAHSGMASGLQTTL